MTVMSFDRSRVVREIKGNYVDNVLYDVIVLLFADLKRNSNTEQHPIPLTIMKATIIPDASV
jgi:hypothetical protein